MRSHMGHKPRSVSYARFIGSLAWVCLAPYPIRISCTDTLLAPLYGRAHSRPRAPLYWGLLKGYVLGAVRLALRLFPRDLLRRFGSSVTRLSIHLRLSD